jgi:hypothetical protein
LRGDQHRQDPRTAPGQSSSAMAKFDEKDIERVIEFAGVTRDEAKQALKVSVRGPQLTLDERLRSGADGGIYPVWRV